MPKGFTARFAHRLNDLLPIKVVEATDRMPLETGTAYIAPGGNHLRVEKSSGQLKCRVTHDEATSGHRPSVDVLFGSVAKVVGPMAVRNLQEWTRRRLGVKLMREAGAFTIGQPGLALTTACPRSPPKSARWSRKRDRENRRPARGCALKLKAAA